MADNPDFGGEIAGFYHQYRRGYPPAVIGNLTGAFQLTSDDIVIDLGCGTGQLTLPLATQVRAIVGMDPEPAMLARARQAATGQGIMNAIWVLGADTDLPTLAALLGQRSAGAITIGQALHWMRYGELIPSLVPLLRPGGGIAVITNGTPMWLQDSPWASHHYTDELSFDHLIGSLYSAMRPPAPAERPAFTEQIRRAVTPHAPFTEHVTVRMLFGR